MARHYASPGPADVAGVIGAFADAPAATMAALLDGIAAGWPDGRKPSLSDDDRSGLGQMMKSIAPAALINGGQAISADREEVVKKFLPVAKLEGDVAAGKDVFTKNCAVCHQLHSEGAKDAKAWGQSANWVAMSGPIGEKSYTITFLSHPSNLRAPQRWHARDYGLFAVNPFCEHAMNKSQPTGTGNYTLKAGETLTLKYRIAITEGDATVAKCAERFAEYSKER